MNDIPFHRLSREQAFGLEARIIHRLLPLLKPVDDCRIEDLLQYFENLLGFSHVLSDVSLGNLSATERRSFAHQYSERLSARGLFQSSRSSTADAIHCIIDALGELGTIRYQFTSSPTPLQRNNPDVAAVLNGVGHSLKQIGLQENLLLEPVGADYQYIMEQRASTGIFVSPSFFARPLWFLANRNLKNTGVPTRFLIDVQEPWLDFLDNSGLQSVANGYLNLIEGVQLNQSKKAESGSVTTGSISINLGEGSTFNGPLSIGHSIEASLQSVSDAKTEDLRESLDILVRQVNDLLAELETHKQEDVSSQLQAFVREATNEKPNKRTLMTGAASLLTAAKDFGPIAKSIGEVVDKIMTLLSF